MIISLISGFVASTPTTLIFVPIINTIIVNFGFAPTPLIFALVIGINLGGNIIPQGATCDIMTLKIAQDSGVENLNYKRLLKVGASFALIHIAFSILYLLLLILIPNGVWIIFTIILVATFLFIVFSFLREKN